MLRYRLATYSVRIPNFNGFIVAGCRDESTIGRPRDIREALRVTFERMQDLPCEYGPDFDELVRRWKILESGGFVCGILNDSHALASNVPSGLNFMLAIDMVCPLSVKRGLYLGFRRSGGSTSAVLEGPTMAVPP